MLLSLLVQRRASSRSPVPWLKATCAGCASSTAPARSTPRWPDPDVLAGLELDAPAIGLTGLGSCDRISEVDPLGERSQGALELPKLPEQMLDVAIGERDRVVRFDEHGQRVSANPNLCSYIEPLERRKSQQTVQTRPVKLI
jgi:hypothetical protein